MFDMEVFEIILYRSQEERANCFLCLKTEFIRVFWVLFSFFFWIAIIKRRVCSWVAGTRVRKDGRKSLGAICVKQRAERGEGRGEHCAHSFVDSHPEPFKPKIRIKTDFQRIKETVAVNTSTNLHAFFDLFSLRNYQVRLITPSVGAWCLAPIPIRSATRPFVIITFGFTLRIAARLDRGNKEKKKKILPFIYIWHN